LLFSEKCSYRLNDVDRDAIRVFLTRAHILLTREESQRQGGKCLFAALAVEQTEERVGSPDLKFYVSQAPRLTPMRGSEAIDVGGKKGDWETECRARNNRVEGRPGLDGDQPIYADTD
jgi:hypothetical protein